MKHPWIPVALTLAIGAGHACADQTDAGTPSVLVTLTPLRQSTVPHTIEGYGIAQSPASANRSIMASAAEIVAQVLVQDGQEVAAGAPLLQLSPSPDTVTSYAQAQSALRVATQLQQSTQQLYAQHLATAQQLADASKAVTDAHAGLAALQMEGAAGAHVVRAPFHAVVSHVSVTPGTQVAAGAALIDLARPDALALKVGISASDAMQVSRSNSVQIAALGDHRTCAGTVRQRGSMIDPASGMVPVEIELPAGCLLAGESAKASIAAGAIKGYVVPHTAVLVDDHGEPYVVQADGMKARKVQVHLAGSQNDTDVIQGDQLKSSQSVVVSGNYQLDDGAQMRLASPAKEAP